ncbi:Flagellar hook protein FlgE [Fundidesulfovibrio magnetotacticus]|uniref:Flagellar hook protein FlgE n=1 Tax=Fundidesulfovibrio magnetotacticus TaxID=2730080 RepID=A0A6V8LWC4_9BACT|nr:flagellar hook protein FlgE [Fundidesulfovibrio magnetotacticus]GFK94369.1 Flagellar hook protein FlgE [Fundidesulfovibrio magnetotacticus]
MSLMSAMYTGVSGLGIHSQAMSVVGNNLANTSTMGFKRSSIQFEDFFYSNVTAGNTFGQVGLGAGIASIYGDFSQGAFLDSSSSTDMAISGNGFFLVNNPTTGSTYYTRAGNFSFDKSGYLVDPNGYVCQGWKAYTDTAAGKVSNIGALGDIRLTSFQLAPQSTTKLRMVTNLNSSATEKTTDSTDPFFALFKSWNGQADTALSDLSYSYQATIKVYDEAGTAHDVTVYYDKASNSSGKNVWEYVVACDPTEDGRTINGTSVGATSAAGILMTGTITFDSSGTVSSMSAFTLSSGASGDMKDLSNWTQASFSEDGYPLFTANFTSASNASTATSTSASPIKLDLGIHSTATGGGWSGGVANASLVGTDFDNLPVLDSAEADDTTTTSWSSSFSINDEDQDGYASGFLQSIAIDSEGVVTGTYSNNQTKNLFVVALADFTNLQGLKREGSNLYSKTLDSGEPRVGTAGSAGLGSIASGKLEQSNVDTATEMVNMISYQRGFQANSKVISTVDSMLQEVIQLKR